LAFLIYYRLNLKTKSWSVLSCCIQDTKPYITDYNCRRTGLGTQKIREIIVYPESCVLLEAEKPV
jgi:hypothetical protein